MWLILRRINLLPKTHGWFYWLLALAHPLAQWSVRISKSLITYLLYQTFCPARPSFIDFLGRRFIKRIDSAGCPLWNVHWKGWNMDMIGGHIARGTVRFHTRTIPLPLYAFNDWMERPRQWIRCTFCHDSKGAHTTIVISDPPMNLSFDSINITQKCHLYFPFSFEISDKTLNLELRRWRQEYDSEPFLPHLFMKRWLPREMTDPCTRTYWLDTKTHTEPSFMSSFFPADCIHSKLEDRAGGL